MDLAEPVIRPLAPPDAEAFRALRLEALASAPEAFGSSHAEEAAYPPEHFRARVARSGADIIFGAFAEAHLVGMAGFLASDRIKQRHAGTLWGVFVQPAWRGRGLAERLVRAVISHAAQHVLILRACIVTSNAGARRIYRRLGFVPYGVERDALCVDGRFYDDELLALDLRSLAADAAEGLSTDVADF